MLCPESVRRVSHGHRVALAVGILIVLAAPIVVACSSGGEEDAAPEAPVLSLPPREAIEDVPIVTLPEGFVMPDTRGVRLLPFVGRSGPALPAVEVLGGRATLRGIVTGPDGPVPGATVRLERFVGERSGTAEVRAGADGRWSATNVHGGRYRVRAWLAPNLTATEAQLAFVAADGNAVVDVAVQKFEGTLLQANLDTTVLTVGGNARVRALLTRESVNEEGVVVGAPIPGTELRLVIEGAIVTSGANPVQTDGSGSAGWPITCEREGAHRLSVVGPALSAVVAVPFCGPRPESTTTTTTPDVPAFPVGQEFTVPYPGALPAGTYVTFLDGCGVSYQVFENGEWQAARRQATGQTLGFSTPVRDIRPLPGTDGCRYRRTA
jgi:hypothetical protein